MLKRARIGISGQSLFFVPYPFNTYPPEPAHNVGFPNSSLPGYLVALQSAFIGQKDNEN